MKITLENTTRIVMVNDVPARLWEGVTESGVKVEALITRIATTASGVELAEFERDLQEQRAPSASSIAYPLRLVL